jgi:hypothetical protein
MRHERGQGQAYATDDRSPKPTAVGDEGGERHPRNDLAAPPGEQTPHLIGRCGRGRLHYGQAGHAALVQEQALAGVDHLANREHRGFAAPDMDQGVVPYCDAMVLVGGDDVRGHEAYTTIFWHPRSSLNRRKMTLIDRHRRSTSAGWQAPCKDGYRTHRNGARCARQTSR